MFSGRTVPATARTVAGEITGTATLDRIQRCALGALQGRDPVTARRANDLGLLPTGTCSYIGHDREMRSYELRVDVSGSSELTGELTIAATVHLPDKITGPLTVLFGFPGGGFGRGYYDVRLLPGYSQAEYHT